METAMAAAGLLALWAAFSYWKAGR